MRLPIARVNSSFGYPKRPLPAPVLRELPWYAATHTEETPLQMAGPPMTGGGFNAKTILTGEGHSTDLVPPAQDWEQQ